MSKMKLKKIFMLNLFIIILIISSGCVSMGKYSLDKVPSEDTKSFKNIEVSQIEAGVTKDELNPETIIDLRTAIIEAIQKKDIYEKVEAELGIAEGVLQIKCKIIELDNGSQFLRWLVGRFGGKAYLETTCQFINKNTGKIIASGTFSGEITGGFFGGSANQETMSKYVAAAIARFLKKNK